MPPPQFTGDDVGDYYVDEAGDLWRLVAYWSGPTASLERVTGENRQVTDASRRDRVGGGVGAPIFGGYRKLVPQDET